MEVTARSAKGDASMKKVTPKNNIDRMIRDLESVIDVMEIDKEANPQNQEISPQIAILTAAIRVLRKFKAKI